MIFVSCRLFMFGFLGTLERYKFKNPMSACEGCLSNDHEQRDDNKKLDILTMKIGVSPRNSMPIISRKLSK